ncbi:MAG: glycosyltransferase family 9 protein [Verrucomicrobiota bacterium]
MTKPRGKILVIRGGAIGDFVLTLPVFSALRQQFPQTRLEVLAYPHIAQLALAGGLVDQVRPIESLALAGFFGGHSSLDPILAEYFNSFSIVISYLYDPDAVFQENVARVSKAQFIAGRHRPDETRQTHAVDVFLQPLERLAIFDADRIPWLSVPDLSFDVLPSGNWLALHPGSGSERKNWPERNWAELLKVLIASTDFGFLLVGGEAEGEKLDRLAAPLPPHRIKLAQHLPLADLAQSLKYAVGFVGHDSGISHLAAAIGLPGLLLWGETNESIWRPPAPQMRLLRAPRSLAELDVTLVIEQLNGWLAGDWRKDPATNPFCENEIH